jgi:hypothetical protein
MDLSLPTLSFTPTALPVEQATSAPTLAYLTPDALMSYCASRLRGIDTQVQAAFQQQESGNKDAQKLAALESSSALSVPTGDLDLNTEGGYLAAYDAWSQINQTIPTLSDPTTKAALQKVADTLQGQLTCAYDGLTGSTTFGPAFGCNADIESFFNDGKFVDAAGTTIKKTGSAGVTISPGQFQSEVTDAIKGVQSDLSSNAELSMINLQSLMAQRQEAIQVCTNLVQSMGQSTLQVAANVGK